MRLIDWILGLFGKPKEEITFEQAECEPWPFPAPKKKRGHPAGKKPTVKKAAPAVKKTVKKLATKKAK